MVSKKFEPLKFDCIFLVRVNGLHSSGQQTEVLHIKVMESESSLINLKFFYTDDYQWVNNESFHRLSFEDDKQFLLSKIYTDKHGTKDSRYLEVEGTL